MTEKEPYVRYFKREEIRGLFVLGLLAVVASIRVQNRNVNLGTEQNPIYVTIFLDIILLMWSFYAFFMVCGLSEDIVGKNVAIVFREISTWYLYSSFLFLAFLSILFAYSLYHTRVLWALGFIPALLVYLSIKNRKKIKKSLSLDSESFWKRAKSNMYQLLAWAFLVCFLLIMFGTYEEYVLPSFIVGSISLVSFLMAREKVKGKAEKKS